MNGVAKKVQAKVLVDTGHHYQAQNIEQIRVGSEEMATMAQDKVNKTRESQTDQDEEDLGAGPDDGKLRWNMLAQSLHATARTTISCSVLPSLFSRRSRSVIST